jgi:hypothetical protein
MLKKSHFVAVLVAVSSMVACNPSTSEKSSTENSSEVQEVVDRLGLVYVEEGAQEIITYEEVYAAQKAWCNALVEIGRLYDQGEDYRAFAEQVVSEAYNFGEGKKVFFKPTLAYGAQTFRTDAKGTLAYFVGGDVDYPNDKGFALRPWVSANFDNIGNQNEGIQIYGSIAITMGNVTVIAKDGTEVMVDKTWVFKKDKDGKLKIIVHKSSLPFNP